jgi:hypothetical protein
MNFEGLAIRCWSKKEMRTIYGIALSNNLPMHPSLKDPATPLPKLGKYDALYFRFGPDNYGFYLDDGDAKVVEFEDFINAPKEATNDPVNRPAHYTSGKIEVIDFIEDKELGFHLGNVVKYVARAGKKDPSKEVQDLEKARWHLDRLINKLKNA